MVLWLFVICYVVFVWVVLVDESGRIKLRYRDDMILLTMHIGKREYA